MRCSHCGAENPEGKKFCGGCGASISTSLTESAADLSDKDDLSADDRSGEGGSSSALCPKCLKSKFRPDGSCKKCDNDHHGKVGICPVCRKGVYMTKWSSRKYYLITFQDSLDHLPLWKAERERLQRARALEAFPCLKCEEIWHVKCYVDSRGTRLDKVPSFRPPEIRIALPEVDDPSIVEGVIRPFASNLLNFGEKFATVDQESLEVPLCDNCTTLVGLDAASKLELSGRFKESTSLYEKMERWADAGRVREKERGHTVKQINVNLSELIDRIRQGGLSVPYKCASCGASATIDRSANADGLRFCSYCGTPVNLDAVQKILEAALR